ncbi:MAG: hypothetical protein J6P72_00520 [Firmicutes bacterium]|nr:hypothetical protein [Bacillota bacterium]
MDDQLRGRSGRQGDPGKSMFYVSLEDELVRFYGDDYLKRLANRRSKKSFSKQRQYDLAHRIAKAQKRIEAEHFEMRKNVLAYDDVLDEHRNLIYAERERILLTDQPWEMLADLADSLAEDLTLQEYQDYRSFCLKARSIFGYQLELQKERPSREELRLFLRQTALDRFEVQKNQVKLALLNEKIRRILLKNLDHYWMNHLDALEHLREAISLESYGQRDPRLSYKLEAYALFDQMLRRIRIGVVAAFLS